MYVENHFVHIKLLKSKDPSLWCLNYFGFFYAEGIYNLLIVYKYWYFIFFFNTGFCIFISLEKKAQKEESTDRGFFSQRGTSHDNTGKKVVK